MACHTGSNLHYVPYIHFYVSERKIESLDGEIHSKISLLSPLYLTTAYKTLNNSKLCKYVWGKTCHIPFRPLGNYTTSLEHYPDHKSEMAIALTPFEGMVGFRPGEEIVGFLQNVPEFQLLIGNVVAEQPECHERNDPWGVVAALHICFTRMMKNRKKVFVDQLNMLVERIFQEAALLLRLHSQYPGDVDCFAIYFLNLVKLQNACFWESMSLMPTSIETVLTGLTLKFIDIFTLCERLNYTLASSSCNLLVPIQSLLDPYVYLYNTPVPDFAIMKIVVCFLLLPSKDCFFTLADPLGFGNIALLVSSWPNLKINAMYFYAIVSMKFLMILMYIVFCICRSLCLMRH
uniref:Phosphomannose isomerase type I helical insertion domain-containing protein n=1 Tax=Anolis carolinensis TaxID=28377 RepID=A0A803U1F0_ANOCA